MEYLLKKRLRGRQIRIHAKQWKEILLNTYLKMQNIDVERDCFDGRRVSSSIQDLSPKIYDKMNHLR